jgi:asparagine synthase (glutamine-hydrolysing)
MPQYQWDGRPLETWLKKNVPSMPPAYFEWRKQNAPKFFFDKVTLPENPSWDLQSAVDEAERILSGALKYFCHTYHAIGFPPDWHKDPITGIKLDPQEHWSEFSDDADVDIKFIWEVSRFAFVYTLVRAYASSRDERYAEAFWDLVHAWAESNPPNTGPNWMDGQELSLRIMAWTFGLYGFAGSPASTPQRLAQLTVLIASHAERIYQNRSFAIFTHSNHAITEALGLWMTGLFFPELKHSDEYLSFGYLSLEREARAQIFPDGTYSMYSLNYHRFILHIYLYAIRLGELNRFPISDLLFKSITSSIEHLNQLIDPQTGQMPVYGSNDGALVLPLNNCDFTDYRPLLQLGWYITKEERLFEPGEWDEDLFWLCGEKALSLQGKGAGVRVQANAFPHGGTYLLRGPNSKALIRCTDFRSRPSHADQLHVDLWIHGQKIAVDAGTFLYSGESPWRNGLARTSFHNTVTVDGRDQMTMVSRFTWTNWSKGKVLRHEKDLWQGEHDGYKPVSHKRTVMALEGDRWLVVDTLVADESHHYALHWLLGDFPFEQKKDAVLLSLDGMKYKVQVGMINGAGNLSLVRADSNSAHGWQSRYYGHKEPAISLMLEAHQTQVTFWSFFGLEEDAVGMIGDVLRVNSQEINLAR